MGTHEDVTRLHGGKIEPFTTELADSIANDDFSLYSFEGRHPRRNHQDLHVASHRYDEQRALEMVGKAEVVFALHGHRDTDTEFVMPGGRHEDLRNRLGEALADSGFDVREPEPHLGGADVSNICNRGSAGAGVQLEISKALRDRLRDDAALRRVFVEAARTVFLEFQARNGA